MRNLNPLKLANAMAVSFALVHTAFDILSLVAPETLKYVFNSWFHGFNLRILLLEGNVSYDYTKIIFGWITSVAVAWILGYAIAFFYNRFLGEEK